MYYDKRNRENIAKLAVNTKKAALKLYEYAVTNNIEILIVETTRSLEKQREYVKNGHSQTMKSYHLVGQALDFVPTDGDKAMWNNYMEEKPQKFIAKAKELGFEWGGDWHGFIDRPHLQYNYHGYGTDSFGDSEKIVIIDPEPAREVSIVEYLRGKGQDSSFSARQALAKKNGISNYTGTTEQNLQLLKLLKKESTAGHNTLSGVSIVEYLRSKGQDSSFSARQALAQKNGISNYTGTTEQNLQLLNLLKTVQSVNKGNYTGASIVEYLKSIGQDSSFSTRKTLAKKYGISNYTGTNGQNLQLLNLLRNN